MKGIIRNKKHHRLNAMRYREKIKSQRRGMNNSLAAYATGRDNNFNLIRFIAASLVLFTHSFALSLGTGDAEPLRSTIGMTWGSIAVDIFFITSGFLVTSSYFSRNNLLAFVWARILRIYPALIVAIIFCVLVIGLSFTTDKWQEYLLNPQTRKYFVKNITLFFDVEYTLPGVFSDVPYKNAVNGSLWTLPHEVRMYIILAFILSVLSCIGKLLKFIRIRNSILLIGLFSVALHMFNHFKPVLPADYVRLFSMFFIGAVFFIWRDKINLSAKWIKFGLPLLLMSAINKDLFFICYCSVLPFLIFYLAYVPSGEIRKFNRIGDYSYGIYIYAFPVQQSMAKLISNIPVPTMMVTSFMVTLFLSVLSWHLIEKRFIRMKESYVYIENFINNIGLSRWFIPIK